MSKQNCLIIAGEKSGEEHALSFLSDIKNDLPECEFWGVGGDEMKSVGVELLYHLSDFSSWGVSEVIAKIPFYKKALNHVVEEVDRRNCRVAILIDFQTFNMMLAERLKAKGVEVLYYVAPQAWAWKSWRAQKLAKIVHTLFTIIPFEKKWFKERGVPRVKGVTHPLLLTYRKELEIFKREPRDLEDGPIRLLLLPGSRKFEVKNLLPLFIESAELVGKKLGKEISIGLVESPSVSQDLLSPYYHKIENRYTHDNLLTALKWADFAIACSGTVTLTCGLFALPTVVAYKLSLLNELIARLFVKYRGPISLCNIVHEEMVFDELLQREATPARIAESVVKYLGNKKGYHFVIEKLSKTVDLVCGDKDVAHYMSKVIDESYD